MIYVGLVVCWALTAFQGWLLSLSVPPGVELLLIACGVFCLGASIKLSIEIIEDDVR